MEIRVFKFGGASLKDAAAFRQVANILKDSPASLVVLSACWKVTDQLEKMIEAFFNHRKGHLEIWEELKDFHLNLTRDLLGAGHPQEDVIRDLFVSEEWILEEDPGSDFNQCYDQLIGIGELLSSRIMEGFLLKEGFPAQWVDSRDLLLTDDNYREGWVFWPETKEKCQRILTPLLRNEKLILVPGFIGSNADNQTVSLGREGSDYSAAIFSHCLDAALMTIWKDVAGVYNADPRLFSDAVLIPEISYAEAIEMTYYGARVIHLKTIKPLRASNIPLVVRSFLNPQLPGTRFGNAEANSYPPVFILEKNQVLLSIEPTDFSFVAEKDVAYLFNVFHELGFQVNLTINSGQFIHICGNSAFFEDGQMETVLQPGYHVQIVKDCYLLTVRHAKPDQLLEWLNRKDLIIHGQFNGTFQAVFQLNPL